MCFIAEGPTDRSNRLPCRYVTLLTGTVSFAWSQPCNCASPEWTTRWISLWLGYIENDLSPLPPTTPGATATTTGGTSLLEFCYNTQHVGFFLLPQ